MLILSPALFAAQDSIPTVEAEEVIADTTAGGPDEVTYSGPNTEESYLADSIKKTDFSKSEWQKVTKGMDYTETSEKPKPEKKKEYIPEKTGESWFTFNSSVAQTVLIIVAALVLGFVLFRLFRGSVSNTKVGKEKTYSIEELEDALHESDLERYLLEAISKKDFRAAVRIYYLMAIKQLSERDWIRWKKDKTNNQYLYEMSARPNFAGFREITRLFEYAWYGEMTVEETQFRVLDPKFREFLQQLNSLPA